MDKKEFNEAIKQDETIILIDRGVSWAIGKIEKMKEEIESLKKEITELKSR